MKQIIVSFILLFISNSLFAQFSVHLNYSEPTKMGIGIGYDFSKRFWSDLTLSRGCEYIEDADYYSENYVGDKNPFRRYAEVSVSLSANFNMIAKECYDIYLGIGGLYDTEYLFFKLPVGVRIRPFNNLKNIAFQVELQPAIDNDSYAFLFTRLGVHYSF